MFNNESYLENVEKINATKANRRLIFKKFCYIINSDSCISLKKICEQLKINYRTGARLKMQFDMLDKIHKVTVDHAYKDLVFSSKIEVEVFLYLTSGLNFFDSYYEISKKFDISRYNYNKIKNYIISEIEEMKA